MPSYNNSVIRKIQDAIAKARSLPKPSIEEDTIIAATYDAWPAARILYTSCLHSGRTCALAEATLASTSIIPYRETGPVIAFTTNPRSLRTVNLAEAAGILGLDVTVVAPSIHPAVRERLEMSGATIIETGEPGLLIMSIATALWAPPMMGAREARLRGELEELDSAPEWLIKGALRNMGVIGEDSLSSPPLYTPIAAPGAYYHCIALQCGAPIPLDAASKSRFPSSIVYATSVEQHDYRDILALSLKIKRDLVILINSDPVTAGLYSVMAAALITGRAI